MKFFKKRSVALVICLILVLATTLLNTRWKLGGQSRDLRERFFDPDEIGSRLETLCSESDQLASLAEANGVDTQALRKASVDLRAMLVRQETSAAQIYSYYDTLRTELRGIEQQLLAARLSDGDAAAVSQCLESIHNQQSAIGSSDYNDRVSAFRSKNGSLFTRILASLAGVDLPKEFA